MTDFQTFDFARMTTMRVGGYTKFGFLPQDVSSFKEFLSRYPRATVLGNGSNVVFSDGEFPFPVVGTALLNGIQSDKNLVYVEAGVKLSSLSSFLQKNGLAGGEFLCGIPGTVGGAVAMNAGCFGKSIADCALYVQTPEKTYIANECGFGYRTSVFLRENRTVLSAVLCFDYGDGKEIADLRSKIAREKRVAQPLEYASAGSVFRSCRGIPAWKYIEGVGLRGHAVGGAAFSEKHCNFIVNYGKATADDVYRLTTLAKEKVFEKYHVRLREEIRFIGEFL